LVYLVQPEVVHLEYVSCEIDISRGSSYGRTNCDIFDYQKLPKNAYVATKVNVDLYWDVIESVMKMYK
jgi:ribosylpyrimidine nucleosidase